MCYRPRLASLPCVCCCYCLVPGPVPLPLPTTSACAPHYTCRRPPLPARLLPHAHPLRMWPRPQSPPCSCDAAGRRCSSRACRQQRRPRPSPPVARAARPCGPSPVAPSAAAPATPPPPPWLRPSAPVVSCVLARGNPSRGHGLALDGSSRLVTARVGTRLALWATVQWGPMPLLKKGIIKKRE